jgi:cyclopropane fatty-acyl-phospholipid synthase-like methyltransferase
MTATLANLMLQTEHPVAADSNDHLYPWGAANDNTSSLPFLRACERIICKRPIHYMDLGCAGGQLVREFIEADHLAVGVDGATAAMRGNWEANPGNYFGADISRPFRISCATDFFWFDIVTAWEVCEHIPEERIPQFCENIREHLDPAHGLFVASISTRPDVVNGRPYHLTVKSEEWWRKTFLNNKLSPFLSPFSKHEYARTDRDSFHIVCRRAA